MKKSVVIYPNTVYGQQLAKHSARGNTAAGNVACSYKVAASYHKGWQVAQHLLEQYMNNQQSTSSKAIGALI